MAPTQMTQAKLTIFANNGWQYSFKLEAAVNQIVIRGGAEVYYFVLEKEGFISQKMEFTARQLMTTTKEYPLVLKIPWDSIAWSENFEVYNANTFPNSWIADGNGPDLTNNYIDNSISYNGEKSLKLFGVIGSCWASIAYHTLDAFPPFEIELAVRNGNETLSGCNPDRAIIGLNEGTSWTNYSQRNFIRFDGDGKVYGGGGKELGLYNNYTWYLIRIRYESLSTSEIKLSYWINNNYCGSEYFSSLSEENQLNYLEIQVLEGSAWYDDIKILK